MPRYTYLAADLLTGVVRDELPFESAGFSLPLNQAGAFSGVMPLRSEALQHLSLRETLVRGKTAIYVLRDSQPVWGGVYWGAKANVEQNTVNVAAQDWFSYFMKREIRSTLTFTGVDQFAIFEGIIDYAQAVSGGNMSVQVEYEALSGMLRDRTYPFYEAKNIGEALRELAGVEGGFEFAAETTGSSLSSLTRVLRLSAPRRGRRTNLVFELGKNIQLLDFEDDSFDMANDIAAYGSGEGNAMKQSVAQDANMLSAGYPLLQDSRAFKDVSVQATLDAHAQKELVFARNGISALRIDLKSDDPDSQFGSFITGDEVTARGTWGMVDIADVTTAWRVVNQEVSVSESSDETVSCVLTPLSSTVD